MSLLSGSRIATFALLGAALVGLWQSFRLDSWDFDGPGPGLFPQLVAGACVLLAAIVLLSPARAGAGTTERESAQTPETRRAFAVYAAAFFVLAAGTAWAGFVVTAVVVAVMIVRFAERRSWTAAIVYGVACAAIGMVCFGWLLRVDLPTGPIERAFFMLVR